MCRVFSLSKVVVLNKHTAIDADLFYISHMAYMLRRSFMIVMNHAFLIKKVRLKNGVYFGHG